MLIRFWGVHGSLPRPGPSTLKYGGNTACVEVRCPDALIIFDAGSGIRELGEHLLRQQRDCSQTGGLIRAHLFFSHLHWDHVQGFPFFGPVYQPGNEFHLYGASCLDVTVQRIMSDQMRRPNFPVAFEELASSISFHDLVPGDRLTIDGVTVRTAGLNHPDGSLGYRLEDQNGRTVIYASDTDYCRDVDPKMLDLARDADVLICDSMFTPEQYLGLSDDLSRETWGHSTWEGAVKFALAANTKQLVLFHHGNDDRVVEQIEAKARERFPHTVAAYEGLEIEL
jgi:phosphoribosyl 1,2-cyclic phosphodiesterase